MLCVGMHTGKPRLQLVKVDRHMTLMPACTQKPRLEAKCKARCYALRWNENPPKDLS